MSKLKSGAQSWEVASRATECAASGTAFEDGQSIVSCLTKTPEGLARADFLPKEWNNERKEACLVHWRTKFRVPPPKKEEPFKEENAEQAFHQLLEENDPAARNTLFILAVMLERKRLFVEQGSKRDDDGNLLRVYEHKDSDETFLIYDPELSLEQIADVQTEVGLKLGWIEPEPEEEEGTEGEESEAADAEAPDEDEIADEHEDDSSEDEDAEEEDAEEEEEFDDEDEEEFLDDEDDDEFEDEDED